MSDVLVQYLREARATEAGLSQTLQVHIAATPPGLHQARLEEHLDDTRAHERMLDARLRELGQGGADPLQQALTLVAAPVGYSLGIARGAARAMLSVIGLPLSLMRGREADADRVLRNVRAECASEALEVATYTAIERLAEAEGDTETAQLAAEIRADEEAMLEYLQDAVVELSDRLAGRPQAARRGRQRERPQRERPQATGHRPQRQRPQATGGRPQRERPQATGHRPQRERPQATGLRPRAGNGAATAPPTPETRHPTPQPPTPETHHPSPQPSLRAAPSVHVSEEPELVAEFGEAGAEEEAGAEVAVAEPWEDYDRMKAAEIEQRLAGASDELVAVVHLYETAGKSRQTVLRAAERRLR